MAHVAGFLFVTPIVACLGGILGAAAFHKLRRTKYNKIIRISGAFIWLSSIVCLLLWGEINTLLVKMGKASPDAGEAGTVVITNATASK